MLPAFIIIVKPSVPQISGDPPACSKFKVAFEMVVEWKFKFLLHSMERGAKSCFAKFIPGTDKYKEAWTALKEHYCRMDTVLSAAKKRLD